MQYLPRCVATSLFILLLLISESVVYPATLAAQPASLQARTSLHSRGLQRVMRFTRVRRKHNDRKKQFKRIAPVVLRGRVSGLGPVEITLNRRRASNWTAYRIGKSGVIEYQADAPVLLKGRAVIGRAGSGQERERVSAALSLYQVGSYQQMTVSFFARGRGGRNKLFQLRGILDRYESKRSNRVPVSITRIAQHPFSSHSCAAHVSTEGEASAVTTAQAEYRGEGRSTESSSSETHLWADIVAQADFEYFSRYGSSGAINRIESTLHEVDALYSSDLGIRFRDATIVVLTTNEAPYQGLASSGQILNAFTGYNGFVSGSKKLPAADVYHLFSGKTFESNIVGLAWVGGVCAEVSGIYLGFGISSDLGSQAVNKIVVGHEIGHNFGANHSAGGIMAAVANDATFSFSSVSKSEIDSYIDSIGSSEMCLEQESVNTPTPAPSATPSSTPEGGGGGSGGGGTGGGGNSGGGGGNSGNGSAPAYYLVISKMKAKTDRRRLRGRNRTRSVVVQLFDVSGDPVAGETINLLRVKGKRKVFEFLSGVSDDSGKYIFAGISKPWKVKGRVTVDGAQTYESRTIRVLKKPKKR